MQDTEQQVETEVADAEGTEERTDAAEAIVEQAKEPVKAASILDVKKYFTTNGVEPTITEMKEVMAKDADGKSHMDDLKKALTPDADGNIPYTY